MKVKIILMLAAIAGISSVGVVCAAEWNHEKAGFDKDGVVQLKDANGNTWTQNNNSGYKGLTSTSSPSVLSVSVGSSSAKELYDLAQTPAQSNYIANLYEPLVVGERYEITMHYYRTGGGGTYSGYACTPVWVGKRIIEYTGPGQTFKGGSACLAGNYGNTGIYSTTFTITNDTTIEGNSSANNYNTYYGYTMYNIVNVLTVAGVKKEIYSIWKTPAQSNYRAIMSEPLVVGKKYEITGYYYRTGGAGYSSYACLPVSVGTRIIEYTGAGQTFNVSSTCDGAVRSSTFTITNDTTIDGNPSGSIYNTYYGYTMDNISQVIAL